MASQADTDKLNAAIERVMDAEFTLAFAAIDFVVAHPEVRIRPCKTASALVLAVDRCMDALDDEKEETDGQAR